MEEKFESKPTDSPAKSATTGRATPIPLADRRRLMREVKRTEASAQIITDWASF